MPVNNVSLTSPYAVEQQSIERRRRLAELMQQQSMQQQPTEMAGGWAIPQGPLAGVSKLAQALAGAYGMKQADEQSKSLAGRRRQALADAVGGMPKPRQQEAPFGTGAIGAMASRNFTSAPHCADCSPKVWKMNSTLP